MNLELRILPSIFLFPIPLEVSQPTLLEMWIATDKQEQEKATRVHYLLPKLHDEK
jgi:hypothetical protein